jgi:hypothetical protein
MTIGSVAGAADVSVVGLAEGVVEPDEGSELTVLGVVDVTGS